ncbi:hypothetical protein [Cellulomonas citrea]|uniref:hypothetical protein n=1 Tax=Cellulomonas citrea TaxID=1909423 RepID=UPI00135ACE86|nr:hypothetical protein [Cellulomonas citrea]
MTSTPATGAATEDGGPTEDGAAAPHLRPARRAGRRVLEMLGELLLEAVLALLSFGLFLAVATLAVWAWGEQPVVTAGCAAGFVALLAYGVWVQLPARRKNPRGPLARFAVGLLTAMGFWLVSLASVISL